MSSSSAIAHPDENDLTDDYDGETVSYATSKKIFSDLKDQDVDLVVIGYTTCPHTARVVKMSRHHDHYKKKGKTAIVTFDFGSNPYKSKYKGTFPVVYVRDKKGRFVHVGGADQFISLMTRHKLDFYDHGNHVDVIETKEPVVASVKKVKDEDSDDEDFWF